MNAQSKREQGRGEGCGRRTPLVLAVLAMGLGACTTTTTITSTVGPAEPARRAAQSFIHCVESEGGNCVEGQRHYGSWDAFALLEWLGSGSPTSILQALRRELEHHRDWGAIQDRFVVQAARYREPLRGAECRPESATPLSELLPTLRGEVETRMTGLGLWRGDLEAVVDGLRDEAHEGLDDGWLVHMTCYSDPYELWVATSKEEDRQVVVGMLTSLPIWLGGDTQGDELIEGRIRGRGLGSATTLGVVREGSVDSNWIPVPIEEF